MALTPRYTLLAINTKVAAQAALANGGSLKVYDGSQPATADSPITTQVLLVTLTFSATAFDTPVAGVATANPITAGTAAVSGTPTWFRLYKSDGVTAICDGSAGTSGTNLVLSHSPIVAGATVGTTAAFTMTEVTG